MNYKVKYTKILAFLSYLFPNWRIKNQILVIQFFFCSFVVLFTLLSYHILFNIVREMLISNHQNILVKKQLARSTNNNLIHYQWLTQVNLQHTDIQLYQIRRLYEFSLDENPILEFQPYQCLQQPPNDTIIQNSTFCYGIFGTQEVTVEQENLKQLSKVLTFLMPQLQSEIIQYVTTSDDQFFTFWPGYYFNNSYIPHNRLWYKGAINPIDNRSIQYTTPYLSQVGRVIVSKMIKLREDGVVSIHTKLPKFSIIKDQYTPQILDQTGLFYYTFQYENSYKDMLYFNQSNQTGFNSQDLEQIMNLKNGEQYNNSCDVLLKNSVCIKDSYGKDYNFFIQDLFNTNLSILVKTESQKFENILYDLFQQFDDFKNQIKQNLYLLIATTIFLCCLFFIASNFYLQRPFDRLLHYSTFYIKNPQLQDYYYQMEQLNISQQSYSELFNQLYKSILNITSLQSKGLRNKEKTIIEKFQYPNNQKIDQEINKLLKYLWNQQEM